MFTSINPFTRKPLKSYNALNWEQISEKITLSGQAYQSWKTMPVPNRIEGIRHIAQDLRDNIDEYSVLLTSEMGKLKKEAEAEVSKCALLCDYYAENAGIFLAPETIKTEYSKSYVAYQPIGVILGIMPWNFPFWQSFRFAIPALLAGNTVLLKPAPNVPQSGLQLQTIFGNAFENKGIFQTILADVPEISKIIEHPMVAGVSLTGSHSAGATVAAQAGAAIKKCLLELGGSDPFIVLEDADITKAIENGFASRMVNCGQTCISAKRFILHEKIADRFINGLKQKIEALVPGDPADPLTSIAVMARQDLAVQLQEQVDKSVAMGATILHTGGQRDKKSNYFHPVILSNVQPGMPAYEEELFGPVFSVFIVGSNKEAIEIANDSRYGLGASIWSEEPGVAECMGLELKVGTVAINDMVKSDPRLPFGGVNQSGFGRELGKEGIREFVNVKSVVLKS